MKRTGKKSFFKKATSFVLAFGLCISGVGMMPVGNVEAKAADANAIEISSKEDLQKIGIDQDYPLNGDYVLTADIDMSDVNFTPIGGGEGTRGASSGKNVFTGTFDGDGHVISNLTIQKKDDSNQGLQYGLFGIIGSDDANDKASVKNLILANINIDMDMTMSGEAYLSLGGLAGEANRNAEIGNIAIIGGEIKGNLSNKGDVVGVGGLIGEMRPNSSDNSSASTSGVTISNIYVSADVASGSSGTMPYAGGIIGRIANQSPDRIESCLFTGTVKFKEGAGYGIHGGRTTDTNIYTTIRNCYYLSGESLSGTRVTEEDLKSEKLLPGLDSNLWTASNGTSMILKQCTESETLQDILALSELKPSFAKGDSSSAVTENFTVPTSIVMNGKTEAVTWSSNQPDVLSIDAEGNVTVTPLALKDVDCELTAETAESKRKKTITITVKSTESPVLKIEQEYATVGEPLTATVTGIPDDMTVKYTWSLDKRNVSTENSYTPTENDLQKMLTVTADIYDSDNVKIASCEPVSMFISNLPVVYINTNDGYGITSKTEYKDATMYIQGNDNFKSSKVALYDGDIEIRGRGNTTWNVSGKRPYKLKLGKKTSLFGFGSSKHWALLANYMDESLLRNKTSYDLAETMGIKPSLPSTHVELILNGSYTGNYQLVGNVRIDKSRVDIYNWEDLAEDAAKAIAKAEKEQNIDQDALEDYMNQNMQWITSGKVTFGGHTYKISDYAINIPQNVSGGVDVSGGFLFELDGYYDEISRFRTTTNQPIMFKNPEFIRPTTGEFKEGAIEQVDDSKEKCDALYDYAHQYIQAVEDTVHSPDYYVNIKETASKENASNFTTDFKGRQHYTDLVDLDSLVKYLMINEFYWNTETMKKSTYMYKDLGQKLMIGPVWDMDWTSNSIVSQGETCDYSTWMVAKCQSGSVRFREQKESWYRYLIGDPYFVEKLYECYWDYRNEFYEIVKSGGIIDQQYKYLEKSGSVNNTMSGGVQSYCTFDEGVGRLRTFLQNRLAWMDRQFGWSDGKIPDAEFSKTTLDGLLTSFKKYQDIRGKLSVSVDTKTSQKETTYTAEVKDASIKKVGFYINGILVDTKDVENQKAVLTISDGAAGLEKNAEKKAYVNNVVQVRAMNDAGDLMTAQTGYYNDKPMDVCISDYTLFQKEMAADELTGTVQVRGRAKVGCVLEAVVSDTNNSGTLSYQWKADGKDIKNANKESFVLTDSEKGKKITVEVTSSLETGFIVSEETAEVVKIEVKNDHIIINQVFGGGKNDKASISHSFIELYNPTEESIRLEGYKIGYYSGRLNKDGVTPAEGHTNGEVYLPLDTTKEIPSHHSYLIRCEEQVSSKAADYMLKIDLFDQQWPDQTIANKQYKLILYNDSNEIADAVSVNEESVEGIAILDPPGDEIVSKHKTIRRKYFADTDNNSTDFEIINYEFGEISESDIAVYRPRSLVDTAWEQVEPEPDPEPTELKGTVSIRGNAIAGAHLYADVSLEKGNYDGELVCTWKANEIEIKGETGRFLTINDTYAGKKISVEVTSADKEISGKLPASMASAIEVVEAQRNHVIINQVYGDGGKKSVPMSHSFIELYNPTNEELDLSGYSIQYQSGSTEEKLSLSGKIPSRCSYLIRCKASNSADAAPVQIAEGDAAWENLTIDNKQYRILLKNGENQIDGVSVNEDTAEGTPLTDPVNDEIISKNKAIRRINFVDTDQNVNDFEVLNYTNLSEWNLTEIIGDIKPRNLADEAWGLNKKDDDKEPDKPEEPDEETIRNAETAKEEAESIKSQYTEEAYAPVAAAYEDLLEALKSKDAEQIKQATKTLNQAIKDLKEANDNENQGGSEEPDEATLKEADDAQKAAEDLKSQYAEEAYAPVAAAYEALLEALETKDAEQIKQATETLNRAIKDLKEANDKGNQDDKKPSLTGTKFTYQNGNYQITKDSGTEYTVTYLNPTKKTLKNIKIPAAVSYNGISYKVTAIADRAFEKNKKLKSVTIGANVETIGASAFAGDGKLKKIIVQTSVLKTVGKKALKGIASNCKIKVPKNMLKAYKKTFKKKGQKSSVRIVK